MPKEVLGSSEQHPLKRASTAAAKRRDVWGVRSQSRHLFLALFFSLGNTLGPSVDSTLPMSYKRQPCSRPSKLLICQKCLKSTTHASLGLASGPGLSF